MTDTQAFIEGHEYMVVYRASGMPTAIQGAAVRSPLSGKWIIDGTGPDDGATVRLNPDGPYRARHLFNCCDSGGGSFSNGNPFGIVLGWKGAADDN